jgi:hypothetical protein
MAYHLFRILEQCCSGSIYAPTPLSRLQFSRRGAFLARGCLLQPLAIGRVRVLGLALLVVTIAEAEGVVIIRLGMGSHRSQRLPLLAARLSLVASLIIRRGVAVKRIYLVNRTALGRRYRSWLEEVGVRMRTTRRSWAWTWCMC